MSFAEKLLRGLLLPCGAILYASGALTSTAGLGVALFQCALWLRDGHWTYFTVGHALGERPPSAWGGVAQIIEWIWLQPLSATLIATGFLAIGAGIVLSIAGEEAGSRDLMSRDLILRSKRRNSPTQD
jgi:hypothetical protein